MTENRKEAKVRMMDFRRTGRQHKPLYSTIIEAADLFLGKLSYRYENGRFLKDKQLPKIIYINQ